MEFPETWSQGDSLGGLISNKLRFKIISGDIPRNTLLTENQISTEFDTSRSPVREALKTLEMEGLVELGRSGANVQGLSKSDIEELNDVRFLLEDFCLTQLINNFSENKAAEFFRIIDLMELSMKHNDFKEFAYYDLQFHEAIIFKANHKRIFHFWKNIRNIVLCLMLIATQKRFEEDWEEVENLIKRHKIIINSLLNKDNEQLKIVVKKHMLDTNTTVADAYLRSSLK